jgi:hypothetical protein
MLKQERGIAGGVKSVGDADGDRILSMWNMKMI